jgi:hypothetical protein
MKMNYKKGILKVLLTALACCGSATALAGSEVNVEQAGTLSTLLPTSESELKVTGSINGTDVKYLRELIKSGGVTSLDLSEVHIVSGGVAYYENNKTSNDIIGNSMFYQCSKLKTIVLPSTVTEILGKAFANTGIKSIDIPNSVSHVGEDAFAYCSSLNTVVIGRRVSKLDKGVFYGSDAIKHVYAKPVTPPSVPSYFFSARPTLHVYAEALADYKASDWKQYYGTIKGDLDDLYPQEEDESTKVNKLCANFFEDAACTTLKAPYSAMSDEDLRASFTEAGMPDFMTDIALKIKNDAWASYEKEFRINSYKAYSDATYWHEKLWIRCASYMGNPTGIHATDLSPLYVFVDDDVPADATLYFAGIGLDHMITSAKTGTKLKKGLNIIDGVADNNYYILYTADTKSMTKRLSEWPELKIHIEGGVVDGYFDSSRHTDADYKAMLKKATFPALVIKGEHSVMSIWTSILKQTYPSKIAKAIECLDSLSVWEKDLSGICESVANGEKAGAPFYLSGGDAFYPGYFNNPTFADNDSPGSVAHATEFGIHISPDATKTFLNPYVSNYDENGTAHELGHQMQYPIMLCGFTEGTNDLFSNYCRFQVGHRITSGNPLSTTMQEFANHVPFNIRNVNNSCLRLFFSLYLYYHQVQKNTSFFPELFKALRADRMESMGDGAINNNKSTLKFVRKVCETAQEDLTDFFTVYGFFEPTSNLYVQDYGDHYVTTKQADIDKTKATIAKYPVKNRAIIFIEDRAEVLPTTSFVTTAGKKRLGQDDNEWGNVGQFTSYLPGACQPSSYTYLQSDSLFAMEGSGGIGFIMLDGENNLVYAANAYNFSIPSSVNTEFTIYSVDADGTLHEVTKAGEGAETVWLDKAGTLSDSLSAKVLKATIGGYLNGTDFKYMRQLINEGHLVSIDMGEATIKSGGSAYYESYKTSANAMGDHLFYNCKQLIAILLPKSITRIAGNAFAKSGLKEIDIPDGVTTVGEDAFAYCNQLARVVLGEKVKTLSKGVFYGSEVKDVFVKPTTPPSVSSYLFSSNPTIHVHKSALAAYKATEWANYGTLVGDLDDYDLTPVQAPRTEQQLANTPSAPTYDLFGRRVTALKPNTIYVRNGRKFITAP